MPHRLRKSWSSEPLFPFGQMRIKTLMLRSVQIWLIPCRILMTRSRVPICKYESTFHSELNQYFNSKDFEYLRDIVRERLGDDWGIPLWEQNSSWPCLGKWRKFLPLREYGETDFEIHLGLLQIFLLPDQGRTFPVAKIPCFDGT